MTFDGRTDATICIIVRDRLTCLQELVGWLEDNGYENILMLDNDSAYPPLLEWLEQSPHEVRYVGYNGGYTIPHKLGLFNEFEHLVITDPDVVPLPDCPGDVVDVMYDVLRSEPSLIKAGLSLDLDIPEYFYEYKKVIKHEPQFWQNQVTIGPRLTRCFWAAVDSTFALYRPGCSTSGTWPAVRLDRPYTAKHTGWFHDNDNLPPDIAMYNERRTPRRPWGEHYLED